MTAPAEAGMRSVPVPPGLLRKWGPWVLLIGVAVAALAVGFHRGGGRPSLDSRVQHLASQVRCPVCHGETVAQSQAAPSVEIRNEIRSDLQRGESDGQILEAIVAAYGPGILEKPQAKGIGLLVWTVPIAAAVLAAGGLGLAFRRWKLAEAGSAPSPSEDHEPSEEPAPVAGEAGPAVRPPVGRRLALPAPRLLVGVAGVALVGGGITWAVAASSGTRLPGQEITGQSLGSQAIAAHIQNAQTDESRNDVVGALKEYQAVLASDPNQVQALTGEGWLLAGTGQPSLLQRGLTMLTSAEKIQPGYSPAHVYRGIALLSEDDYVDSIPELQWYLAHNPDPKLIAPVRSALTRAQSAAASASSATSLPSSSSSSSSSSPSTTADVAVRG